MAIEAVHLLPVTATGERVAVPPRVDPDEWARFVRCVAVVPGGCHLWIGELFGAGYGRFTARAPAATLFAAPRQVVTGAHRYAYAAARGPIPAGMMVRHQCDEPLCAPVTAAAVEGHLTLGDDADNAHDRQLRGRGGSRRHGLRWRGADTRDRHCRSVELRDAVRAALESGAGAAELPGVVELVAEAGDPYRGQLPLPLARRLYVVR